MWSASARILYSISLLQDGHYTDPLALAISRECIIMSTGVLLLADTVPSLTVSLLAPFMPLCIKYVFFALETQLKTHKIWIITHLCFSIQFFPTTQYLRSLRMALACLLSATGFIVVASAQFESQAILGIIFTSLSSGLGETSMLAYTAKFNR